MNIPDAELEVLKALWKLGPSTIRELTKRIYPEGGTSAYATVQKLLERLIARSCVEKSRKGRSHTFAAVIDRENLIGHHLRRTADRLCGGSVTPLLTQLIDSGELSKADPNDVLELLKRLEDQLAGQAEEGP